MSYKYFLKALKREVDINWKRKRSALALDAGISSGHLSSVISEQRQAGYDTQDKIAKACGFTYFEFLKYGQEQLEGDLPPPKKEDLKQGCEICEKRHSYEDPMMDKIQEMLRGANETGDKETLKAVFKCLKSGVKTGGENRVGTIEERVAMVEDQIDFLLGVIKLKKTG